MILLDWTRMGRSYCLAGAVAEHGHYRVVRPLLVKHRDAPVRNVGWSAYQVDGHARWEIFELIGLQPAAPEPPHLEDLWVRTLRSRGALAPIAQRREVLAATTARLDEALFGVPLCSTRSAAYLLPGTGQRSLATVVVPSASVSFSVSWREGTEQPDVRVLLPLPGLSTRPLPVKDHHLLLQAERVSTEPEGMSQHLNRVVRQMGPHLAVRLGLSRRFQARSDHAGECWLMVDGFFSLSDPQP